MVNRLQPLREARPTTVSEVSVTFICSKCGAEAQAVRPSSQYRAGERRSYECPQCAVNRRRTRFEKICPPLYQSSDPARLPGAQLAQVMAWGFNPRGLVLIGDTGKGKSRIAWYLLRRYLTKDRPERGFLWFDCIGFGHAITEHYKAEDAEGWLESVAKVPLLFFDDLGKLKMTERAETELFGIIERRCANMLPIIATTNDSGDSLAARMTENRGPAMVRRLREFCQVVTFQ